MGVFVTTPSSPRRDFSLRLHPSSTPFRRGFVLRKNRRTESYRCGGFLFVLAIGAEYVHTYACRNDSNHLRLAFGDGPEARSVGQALAYEPLGGVAPRDRPGRRRRVAPGADIPFDGSGSHARGTAGRAGGVAAIRGRFADPAASRRRPPRFLSQFLRHQYDAPGHLGTDPPRHQHFHRTDPGPADLGDRSPSPGRRKPVRVQRRGLERTPERPVQPGLDPRHAGLAGRSDRSVRASRRRDRRSTVQRHRQEAGAAFRFHDRRPSVAARSHAVDLEPRRLRSLRSARVGVGVLPLGRTVWNPKLTAGASQDLNCRPLL